MDVFAALAPSAGLLVLFIVLMRSIVLADRRERAALARARAERSDAVDGTGPGGAARLAAPPRPVTDNASEKADEGNR